MFLGSEAGGSGGRTFSSYLAFGLVLLFVISGVAVIGFSAGNGDFIVAAGMLAAVAAFLISAFPVFLLGLVLGIAFIAAGLAKLYVPGLQEIRWAVVPLSMVLLFHVAYERLSTNNQKEFTKVTSQQDASMGLILYQLSSLSFSSSRFHWAIFIRASMGVMLFTSSSFISVIMGCSGGGFGRAAPGVVFDPSFKGLKSGRS